MAVPALSVITLVAVIGELKVVAPEVLIARAPRGLVAPMLLFKVTLPLPEEMVRSWAAPTELMAPPTPPSTTVPLPLVVSIVRPDLMPIVHSLI